MSSPASRVQLEATSIALRDYCRARRDPNATPGEIARRLAKFEEFQAKWIAMVDKPKRKRSQYRIRNI